MLILIRVFHSLPSSRPPPALPPLFDTLVELDLHAQPHLHLPFISYHSSFFSSSSHPHPTHLCPQPRTAAPPLVHFHPTRTSSPPPPISPQIITRVRNANFVSPTRACSFGPSIDSIVVFDRVHCPDSSPTNIASCSGHAAGCEPPTHRRARPSFQDRFHDEMAVSAPPASMINTASSFPYKVLVENV